MIIPWACVCYPFFPTQCSEFLSLSTTVSLGKAEFLKTRLDGVTPTQKSLDISTVYSLSHASVSHFTNFTCLLLPSLNIDGETETGWAEGEGREKISHGCPTLHKLFPEELPKTSSCRWKRRRPAGQLHPQAVGHLSPQEPTSQSARTGRKECPPVSEDYGGTWPAKEAKT